MELKKTDKNIYKLICMARECNSYNGSHDWVEAYHLDEIDDVFPDMNRAKSSRKFSTEKSQMG